MSELVEQDSSSRALVVVLLIAFICGLLVSVVAVGLRPVQIANIEAERLAKLELVLNALADIGQARTIDDLEAHIVELANGQYDDTQDVATFNAGAAIGRPGGSLVIPGNADLAGIKRRALYARVYLVRGENNATELIILPVYGQGYQSTLRAWLVLDGDTRTIQALKFYQHGETPGVGARIEEPEWEALWRGVSIYDDDGILRIGVKLQVEGGDDGFSAYRVDGISGATRTTQGVDGLLRFWLGELGFAPYLKRLREEQP